MPNYERIPYSSFVWKFGTTSFRTKEFNFMTEWQLDLLEKFWLKPENSDQGWEKKYMAPDQTDIYEIKNRYYDWLVENDFMKGDEPIKYKTAREKTSGLYDLGLINENHRLTEAGKQLLSMFKDNSYSERTQIGISKDSSLYLQQLLKSTQVVSGSKVRPFIVVVYLLSKLGYLTYEEFTYLAPLCIDDFSTSYIQNTIQDIRDGRCTIDDVICDFLLNKENYKKGLDRFVKKPFSEDLLLSVSMNRKSPSYDKPYVEFYNCLHSVYMDGNDSDIFKLFLASKKISGSAARDWRKLLFKNVLTTTIKNNPKANLKALPASALQSEEEFKAFFFMRMHLYKTKSTLEDYLDLNRRYLGLTNCFLFEDRQVKLDIVPKYYLSRAISELYNQAYQESPFLESIVSFESICPSLLFEEQSIINGINNEFNVNATSITEAYEIVDNVRYERFNRLIEQKFDDQSLLTLLTDFEQRNDDEIFSLVTDNADAPTIFEYILGIIWYKASNREGKILDYLKLSLDANLLPVTHAAGGEADIVYEYSASDSYPKHNLLLEATLADSTNQRRMEMEPVSRHLGNHLLRTKNSNSYCVFATNYLHPNVIGDFMNRKTAYYLDSQNPDEFVKGMKIIPICTGDLKKIVESAIQYPELYSRYESAYQATEPHPVKWYEQYVQLS